MFLTTLLVVVVVVVVLAFARKQNMVREVVEEDVFVVVVLRPHADRDEEATKRNIFFVFLCSFFELFAGFDRPGPPCGCFGPKSGRF